MTAIKHHIAINASAEKIYQAITTPEGFKNWWTADAVVDKQVGGQAEFGFYNRKIIFTMNIDELVPNKRVAWSCIRGPEEWPGTKLSFEIGSNDGSDNTLQFQHTDWASDEGCYSACNTTWGQLMGHLKDYCEGKEPGPFFSE